MLTVRGRGTLDDLDRLADGWRADLAAAGLRVVRVKIEAAPWNEGVPASDPDAPRRPPLSLAWKIQWLVTDSYAHGKDLYDAVLLAERTAVSPALVRELIRPELGDAETDRFTWASLLDLEVDWENFRAERPGVEGDDAGPWLRRLVDALTRA